MAEPTTSSRFPRAELHHIRTLLIANRGEIASRIIRTAREMGIRTIGVYSEPDRLAPHVQDADVAVPIGGPSAADSYLDRAAILDAAAWQGADAIHPGYGFLSENAMFANAVVEAGLTWVGPPAQAIRQMGDKIEAKHIAGEVGVPILPSADLLGDRPEDWLAAVAEIGYPVLVKATAGGGGKGLRLVTRAEDLADAVVTARREAASSFGNGLVFAERWLSKARHVEIQVFADRYGKVIHLGERECSIQRRHQKVIEESPSPAVDPLLRQRMGDAAIELCRAIGYVGAGTVEYLLADTFDEAGLPQFFFLEMNTRLQVEHALTELRTGIDLVRLQLEIARGEPLRLDTGTVRFDGYAIEARVYAEDPSRGWLPSVGTIHRWQHGTTPGVRYDDGIMTGASTTPFYDPLLSKVIVQAPTRTEAAARLGRALRELQIHGVTTNRDYLVDLLGEEDFLDGSTTTDFIDEHPPLTHEDDPARYERDWQRFNAIIGPHLAAAALADPTAHATTCGPWPFAPTGWRNVGGAIAEMRPGDKTWHIRRGQTGFAGQTMSFERLGEQWDITYSRVHASHPLARRRRLDTTAATPSDLFNVTIGGPAGHTTTLVELIRLDDHETLVHFGRRGHRCTVQVVDQTYYVNSALGQSVFTELPRFPVVTAQARLGGPTAPVPGRVVAIEVEAGQAVEAGDTVVVIEAMKVEHRITVDVTGIVTEVLVGIGDNVEAHQVLVRVGEPEPPADEDVDEPGDAAGADGEDGRDEGTGEARAVAAAEERS
jgi:acetyl/propionyl-CoA carboxylase alpha subunit